MHTQLPTWPAGNYTAQCQVTPPQEKNLIFLGLVQIEINTRHVSLPQQSLYHFSALRFVWTIFLYILQRF